MIRIGIIHGTAVIQFLYTLKIWDFCDSTRHGASDCRFGIATDGVSFLFLAVVGVAVVWGGGLVFGVCVVLVRGGYPAAVTGLATGAVALLTVPLGFLPLLVAADALALVFAPAARRQRAALRSPRYPLRDPSFMLSSVKLSSWLFFRPPPRRSLPRLRSQPSLPR